MSASVHPGEVQTTLPAESAVWRWLVRTGSPCSAFLSSWHEPHVGTLRTERTSSEASAYPNHGPSPAKQQKCTLFSWSDWKWHSNSKHRLLAPSSKLPELVRPLKGHSLCSHPLTLSVPSERFSYWQDWGSNAASKHAVNYEAPLPQAKVKVPTQFKGFWFYLCWCKEHGLL